MPLIGPLNEAMRKHAERGLRQCIQRKLVSVPSAGVALDFGYGLGAMMIRRALHARLDFKEIDAAGLMFLRAYGVKEIEARRIVRLPLLALPELALRAAVINNFGPE
jgi:hypothetical protein